MNTRPNDKILRDEALKRVKRSDILHSSGFVTNDSVTGGISSVSYRERKEMVHRYVGHYDKSKLGAGRSPAMRARPVDSTGQGAAAAGARPPARRPGGVSGAARAR